MAAGRCRQQTSGWSAIPRWFFDAAHHAAPIIDAVGGRKVVVVILMHGHNDHVTVAPELGTALDALSAVMCIPATPCCGE